MHPHSAESTEKLVERQRLMARALAVILAPDFTEGDEQVTNATHTQADAPTAAGTAPDNPNVAARSDEATTTMERHGDAKH